MFLGDFLPLVLSKLEKKLLNKLGGKRTLFINIQPIKKQQKLAKITPKQYK